MARPSASLASWTCSACSSLRSRSWTKASTSDRSTQFCSRPASIRASTRSETLRSRSTVAFSNLDSWQAARPEGSANRDACAWAHGRSCRLVTLPARPRTRGPAQLDRHGGPLRKLASIVAGRRAKWLILVGWILAVAIAGPIGSKLSDETVDDTESFLPASAESTEVVRKLDDDFTQGETDDAIVVYKRDGGLTAP